MKRSDMLNKLETLLYYSMGNYKLGDHVPKSILKLIEELGMLPPKIDNVEPLSNSGFLSLDAALNRGLHEWEQEDDESEKLMTSEELKKQLKIIDETLPELPWSKDDE